MEDPVSPMMARVADKISAMEATAPEIIRAVRAGQALRCWGQNMVQASFRVSFPSQRIRSFWSHSWRGNRHFKIATLLYLYNHTAAVLCATFAALVIAILFAAQIIPGFAWEEHRDIWSSPRGFYATLIGTVIYLAVLLLWPSRQPVFMDCLCINQKVLREKLHGLLSMGAFLKRSDSIVVLWDPTYTRRLWCLFEIAAFLHSRPAGSKAKLYIRPLVLGPCSLIMTLSMVVVMSAIRWLPEQENLSSKLVMWACQILVFVVGLYAWIAVMRGYFRALDQLRGELQNFSMEKTECYCCSQNHVNPDGTAMRICDRKVLLQCIDTWYGSIEGFEEAVKTQVLNILLQELPSRFLTYEHLVTATIPFFWANLDFASAGLHYLEHWNGRTWRSPLNEFIRLLAWWLGMVPALAVVATRLSCALRHRRPQWDGLVTLFIVLCTAAICAGVVQVEQLHFILFIQVLCPWPSCSDDYHVIMPCMWLLLSLLFAAVAFRCLGPYPRSFKEVFQEKVMPLEHALGEDDVGQPEIRPEILGAPQVSL